MRYIRYNLTTTIPGTNCLSSALARDAMRCFLLLAVLATFSNAFVSSPLRQSRAATQQQVHAASGSTYLDALARRWSLLRLSGRLLTIRLS